jgi:D-alanyl-D-alanine carboxypeptidase
LEALPFPEPSGGGLPAAQQQALQAALDQVTQPSASGVIRGVTMAVVTPDGSWAGVRGTDGDDVPLVPEAMADIASITKTVTAAEVVFLAQAGQVDLDTTATTYLAHPLLDRDPTVRQLLSHTSGVPEHTTEAFIAAVLADPTRTWTPQDALAYATAPITDPGHPVVEYSNSNYLLLGLIIEKVTGLTYADAVRRDVLAELGGRMAVQTGETPSPPLAAPDQSDGAVPDGLFLPNRALATAAGAAGGIAADAPTLASWGYRLYGGLILPPDRTVELSTPVGPGYGLGTMIVPGLTGTDLLVGHLGGINGYATLRAVDPTRKLSIAILSVGTGGPALDDLIGQVLRTLTA